MATCMYAAQKKKRKHNKSKGWHKRKIDKQLKSKRLIQFDMFRNAVAAEATLYLFI